MIVKHEKQILIFLHHFQEHFLPFSLQKVADSKDFHSNTSTSTLKMKYMTWKSDHTPKYDSKTQTFYIFCTTSKKIPFLPHFQTLQTIEYGPLKFCSHIPRENIYFYVPENEKKKNPYRFFGQFGWFSRFGSHMYRFLYGFLLPIWILGPKNLNENGSNTTSESWADLLCIGCSLFVPEPIQFSALLPVFRAPEGLRSFGRKNTYALCWCTDF